MTIFYGDAKGRFLGDDWQELDLNLKPDTWQRIQREGLGFSTRVPLKAPGQTFKIVVYSYETDRVGSVVIGLKK